MCVAPVPNVIDIIIIAGLSAPPVLFLLAFLGAIGRELRMHRSHHRVERRKTNKIPVAFGRYRRKDLAA